MATCGNCKAEGMTVEHIRGCYASKGTVLTETKPVLSPLAANYVANRASDFKPMAITDDVPNSKYALVREAGPVFYEVTTGRKGKWVGFLFLSRLVGHPGDWKRTPVKGDAKKDILAEIGQDPKAAAIRFSKEFTICAVCGSPLSDPESLALGLGPICATRF